VRAHPGDARPATLAKALGNVPPLRVINREKPDEEETLEPGIPGDWRWLHLEAKPTPCLCKQRDPTQCPYRPEGTALDFAGKLMQVLSCFSEERPRAERLTLAQLGERTVVEVEFEDQVTLADDGAIL
jgi:hypothetical protein